MASRSLIVLPDDAATPILEAIGEAKASLCVKMFVFSDPALIGAVIAAKRRGVHVRVMLNPARRSGEDDNEGTRHQLARSGVDVIDSNPDRASRRRVPTVTSSPPRRATTSNARAKTPSTTTQPAPRSTRRRW